MDVLIKAIVDSTAANERLESKHYNDLADAAGSAEITVNETGKSNG